MSQNLSAFFEKCHRLEHEKEIKFSQLLKAVERQFTKPAIQQSEKVTPNKYNNYQEEEHIEQRNITRANTQRMQYNFLFLTEVCKLGWIQQKMRDNVSEKIIIIVKTQKIASDLNESLVKLGFLSKKIIKNFSKEERDKVALEMNKGEVSILVMTDVTSNLKINGITTIINYNAAKNEAFHLQRLKLFEGSENNDKICKMVMLMSEEDAFLAPALMKILDQDQYPVPQMLVEMARKRQTQISAREMRKTYFANPY